jgi:DNA uptake protein ComE-like DNA-binding protein
VLQNKFITGSALALLLIFQAPARAQEAPIVPEQQLENLTDVIQAETEDDHFVQELEIYKKNPININTAEEEELKLLRLLSDLQIANLISYRRLLGPFISIYELQAIPTWDVIVLRRIKPYITIASTGDIKQDLQERFSKGQHYLLGRISQVLEKSSAYNSSTTGTPYLGSPQRLFFRYKYTYKNLLQYGLLGDKDAGEQFLKGAQRYGFDFYSFHLFARKIGAVQALAIGDFTVNLGQGLIHWQSLAFKKSVEVTGIKRQSTVLRPYNAAGEFNFHRGVGVTLSKKNWQLTIFGSLRKLNANVIIDSTHQSETVSSFLSSGYNRTLSEVADKNKVVQVAYGGNLSYNKNNWHVGLNVIAHQFSEPLQKKQEPYNLYAITGNNWVNASIDYNYTYKNLHFFGEAAMDKNKDIATVNGLLVSVDPRVDVSLLYRNISPGYQAINGNAFTENVTPTNEKGLFSGLAIRPFNGWRLDVYGDVFQHPWLKFQADAPSRGMDYLAQITYTPNKEVEIYTRFRSESKQVNLTTDNMVTNGLFFLTRKNWRSQLSYKITPRISIRNRGEIVWYDTKGSKEEQGFLLFTDFIYKPLLSRYAGIIRLQYFETTGYNSRIYAYENDVLYGFAIPSFAGKGFRYYLTAQLEMNAKLSLWVRLAQTSYLQKNGVGAGPDDTSKPRQTEAKLQFKWSL